MDKSFSNAFPMVSRGQIQEQVGAVLDILDRYRETGEKIKAEEVRQMVMNCIYYEYRETINRTDDYLNEGTLAILRSGASDSEGVSHE